MSHKHLYGQSDSDFRYMYSREVTQVYEAMQPKLQTAENIFDWAAKLEQLTGGAKYYPVSLQLEEILDIASRLERGEDIPS